MDRDKKTLKESVNLLDYYDIRKFDINSYSLYVLATIVLCACMTLIVHGGRMSLSGLIACVVTGLLAGTPFYFWDLKKSRQSEQIAK